ncbi:hypothetical protein [Microbacterium telephonicum]|uniref:Uncharacterized protein n=1 Tax=Microbacterium telephonicum TaxID=1714841 RepID=A0A498C801_9MICO|nr:hypothetical protein [Microbacterium telephonicum]RLK52274.1 hypothetical protein C7474_0206 [Microbacterium telephonicum]
MNDRNRLPIILGAVAGVLVIAVVIALAILLTRGSGAPASNATTPASDAGTTGPSPTSTTPSADPAHPAATRVALASDGFSILTADGEEGFTHAWGDEAAPAIAALTDAFGAAPTEGFQNGDAQHYAYTLYEWAGFTFADVSLGAGNKPRTEVPDPTWVAYTENTVGDVAIHPEFGLAIGLTAAEVDALHPDSSVPGPPPAYLFGTDRNTFYQDGVRAFPVTATADGGEVSTITYRFLTSVP